MALSIFNSSCSLYHKLKQLFHALFFFNRVPAERSVGFSGKEVVVGVVMVVSGDQCIQAEL